MSADSAFISRPETIVACVRTYVAEALGAARKLCDRDGRTDSALLHTCQREAHGLAWTATLGEAIASATSWAGRLGRNGQLHETEMAALTVRIAEYLAQLTSGIPMSQSEIFRPAAEIGPSAVGGGTESRGAPSWAYPGVADAAMVRQESVSDAGRRSIDPPIRRCSLRLKT